jgi:hypothetical protein
MRGLRLWHPLDAGQDASNVFISETLSLYAALPIPRRAWPTPFKNASAAFMASPAIYRMRTQIAPCGAKVNPRSVDFIRGNRLTSRKSVLAIGSKFWQVDLSRQ